MFYGQTIKVTRLDDGFVELSFDRREAAINKLDQATIGEWREATALIAGDRGVRGVLVTSAKEVFIVGADINEFGAMFRMDEADMAAYILRSNEVFSAFEDLDLPTVVAINGLALGGGLEMTLAVNWRVMSKVAQVGLPEVKLGLFPGFGGTVRMARVAGPDVAVEWIAAGKQYGAEAALESGVVDQVCEPGVLRERALDWLRSAADGIVNWRARVQVKRAPVPVEARAGYARARPRVLAGSAPYQPAAAMALEVMEQAADQRRDEAIRMEARQFASVAKTQAAASLVRAFHNDQALKKLFRRYGKSARQVRQGAVLGAGIMGSGIAYASAACGVPVRLKDLSNDRLAAGVAAVTRQVERQVKSGRMSLSRRSAVLEALVAQSDFAGFGDVDVAIEAVVENLAVKHAVLEELEAAVHEQAIIASNTSSLRVDDIAHPLKRPENFVGMHFFNPVPQMALVEVIKGSATSDTTVSTAVAYVLAMGKTPIVVKDCPGFLVNRLLTPYIRAFIQLVADGADFAKVDRVMEEFGWPMGPAYLEDVIGIDTGSKVNDVISAGYSERMPPIERDVLQLMVHNERFGQKNGVGFYRYETGANGRLAKLAAPDTYELLAPLQPGGTRDFTHDEIIERMMLPMMIEAAHALEDGVVDTPGELDMALLLGLGFPRYLGGPLNYADWLGMQKVATLSDKYVHLGEQYRATPAMRAMAATGRSYYPK